MWVFAYLFVECCLPSRTSTPEERGFWTAKPTTGLAKSGQDLIKCLPTKINQKRARMRSILESGLSSSHHSIISELRALRWDTYTLVATIVTDLLKFFPCPLLVLKKWMYHPAYCSAEKDKGDRCLCLWRHEFWTEGLLPWMQYVGWGAEWTSKKFWEKDVLSLLASIGRSPASLPLCSNLGSCACTCA